MKKPTQAQLQMIGCYIYHNHPERQKECVNVAVGHHRIGNQTIKGLSKKADDSKIMAICVNHHTGRHGIHQIGVETWEARYGKQDDMIKWTIEQLEYLDNFNQGE